MADVKAAVLLHEMKKRKKDEEKISKATTDQCAFGCHLSPRGTWRGSQAGRYQGPQRGKMQRMQTEVGGSCRCPRSLSTSSTPVGAVAVQSPGNTNFLQEVAESQRQGCGYVPSGVSSLGWQSTTSSFTPTDSWQFDDCSGPATGDPSKRAIAGVPSAERVTDSQVYTEALTRRAPKQIPENCCPCSLLCGSQS